MLTINMLVALISATCLDPIGTSGFENWKAKNNYWSVSAIRLENYKLECFDHYNNCMVGPNGVIKSTKEFAACEKTWEGK